MPSIVTGLTVATLVEIAVGGIVLHVVLASGRRVLQHVPALSKVHTASLWPTVAVCAWSVFALWAANLLLSPLAFRVVGLVSVSMIALWLWWFVVREVVAGLVVRARGNLEIDQFVTLGDRQGRIGKLGLLSLQLQAEGGERVVVPYSRVSGQIQTRGRVIDAVNSHTFEVQAPPGMDPEEAEERLRQAALLTPWTAVRQPPVTTLVSTADGTCVFELVVSVVSRRFGPAVERDVRQQMEMLPVNDDGPRGGATGDEPAV